MIEMTTYAQGREDVAVANYFSGFKGTLLDIGANDGIHLSNSRKLLLREWGGLLVEPSPTAYLKLYELYLKNPLVCTVNVAVGDYIGMADFFDSGPHLGTGDRALLSTLHEKEKKRWDGTNTTFEMVQVRVVDFKKLMVPSPYKQFDFITIDAEGNDLLILRQMDLQALGCKCICVEHNSDEARLKSIIEYCALFDLTKELLRNAENIVLCKQKDWREEPSGDQVVE